MGRRSGGDADFTIEDAARARTATYLFEVYAGDRGILGDVDPWTQRCITSENMAKLSLVFDSDDPAEACYRDLIREIDTEAEAGIFLARREARPRHLTNVLGESGVSGELHMHLERIAQTFFLDELRRSSNGLELVEVTINARHDRAHVDATVSEIIMAHLLDDASAASDMADALRALQYAFHENVVRRLCSLPRQIDDREERDLLVIVGELSRRSGSYEDRIETIRDRCGGL